MPVPPDFQFSQNNLQDYVECPRRFELRHLKRQKWPALQSEPVVEQENRMKQGERFHQMVYQHLAGINHASLLPNPGDIELCRWWHNYLEYDLSPLPPRRYLEFSLSAPFANFRLLAKYDLLAVEAGSRFVIVDWKTSRKRPSRFTVETRIQTRLYPFLAVLAGLRVCDGLPVQPEQVEMIYWYADYPDQPEVFCYNQQQFEDDRRELYRVVTQITSTPDNGFFPTTMDRSCAFCAYRSLCGRGDRAGNVEDMDGGEDGRDLSSFNFNSIEDIRF